MKQLLPPCHIGNKHNNRCSWRFASWASTRVTCRRGCFRRASLPTVLKMARGNERQRDGSNPRPKSTLEISTCFLSTMLWMSGPQLRDLPRFAQYQKKVSIASAVYPINAYRGVTTVST